MLLKDFLKELESRKEERQAFRTICKENAISYKKLPPLLKDRGFEYDQKAFSWIYKAAGDPPLDLDLAKEVPMRAGVQHKRGAKEVQAAQKQIASAAEDPHKHAGSAADPKQHESITSAQLFDIVDLLQQINEKIPDQTKAPAVPSFDPPEDPEAAPLALQIHNINQSEKARKTINISAEAARWLDSFTEAKGYKIGDIVSLAILQLRRKLDQ